MRAMLTQRISFYWAQGESAAPEIVRRCWDGWARLNPGWEIVISGADEAASAFRDLGIAHPPQTFQGQADIFRLWDICARGGVYVDAATIPVRPLDDWVWPLVKQGFFAFHDPYRKRSVENWFLCSAPGHALAAGWLEAMRGYWAVPRRPLRRRRELDRGAKGRLDFLRAEVGARLTPARAGRKQAVIEPRDRAWAVTPGGGAMRPVHPYFWPHYLFDDLLDRDAAFRAEFARMPKVPSYKPLMLRHWKRRYGRMTAQDVDTLVAGSDMQKLAGNATPPDWAVDQVFGMAGL